MKLLQAKLAQYQEPQKAKALGIYPYFREIESEQDTEVYMPPSIREAYAKCGGN